MKQLSLEQKKVYLEKYPMAEYFDFDVRHYLKLFEFEAEEHIFKEGTKPNYLYYLIEGKAKLYLTHANGKVSLINFITSPSFLGEMELLEAQKTANAIKATSKCICYGIDINACKTQLLSDVKFLNYLCAFLSKKAIANTSNYTKNQSYTLENRLANFILMTSHENIYREKHTEASEYLGVSYRHFLYVLSAFCQEGILKREAYGYRIIDLKRLTEISNT